MTRLHNPIYPKTSVAYSLVNGAWSWSLTREAIRGRRKNTHKSSPLLTFDKCTVIPRQLGDTDPEPYVRATFLKVPCLSHKPTHCILQSMYCRGMRAEAHADLSYPILGGEGAVPSWPAVAGGRQWRPRRGQCAWVMEEKHGQLATHNAKS